MSALLTFSERVLAAAGLILSLRIRSASSGTPTTAHPLGSAPPLLRRPPRWSGARATARRGRGPRTFASSSGIDGYHGDTGHLTVRIYGENYPLRTSGNCPSRGSPGCRHPHARSQHRARWWSAAKSPSSPPCTLPTVVPLRAPRSIRPGESRLDPRRTLSALAPSRRIDAPGQPLPFTSKNYTLGGI
jgi:hypothetical protein